MGNSNFKELGGKRLKQKGLIAQGGYSFVYLVEDERRCSYALKQTRVPLGAGGNDGRANAEWEIKVHRGLGAHDHIVRFIDSIAAPENDWQAHYILMEYCPDNLANRITPESPTMSEREVLEIFKQACEAVNLLHSQNPPIAHRDIKIENFLIGEDLLVKLCDFGSSSISHGTYNDSKTITLVQEEIRKFTTPQYRAPEQVDLHTWKQVNEKVDVWALGVTLYKLCFRITPFEDASGNAMPLRITNGSISFPLDRNSHYSQDLQDFICFLLQVDPTKRPGVQQVLNVIAEWETTGQLHIPTVSPSKQTASKKSKASKKNQKTQTGRKSEPVTKTELTNANERIHKSPQSWADFSNMPSPHSMKMKNAGRTPGSRHPQSWADFSQLPSENSTKIKMEHETLSHSPVAPHQPLSSSFHIGSTSQVPSNMWACTKCTLHNGAKARVCEVCGASKPAVQVDGSEFTKANHRPVSYPPRNGGAHYNHQEALRQHQATLKAQNQANQPQPVSRSKSTPANRALQEFQPKSERPKPRNRSGQRSSGMEGSDIARRDSVPQPTAKNRGSPQMQFRTTQTGHREDFIRQRDPNFTAGEAAPRNKMSLMKHKVGVVGERMKVRVYKLMNNKDSERKLWVLKATNKKTKPPKAKYVRKIIVAFWERQLNSAILFEALRQRPLGDHPLVALKALLTIMKIVQQGPPELLVECAAFVHDIEGIGMIWSQKRTDEMPLNYLGFPELHKLIVCLALMLTNKLYFHDRNPEFSDFFSALPNLDKGNDAIPTNLGHGREMSALSRILALQLVAQKAWEQTFRVYDPPPGSPRSPELKNVLRTAFMPLVEEAYLLFLASTALFGRVLKSTPSRGNEAIGSMRKQYEDQLEALRYFFRQAAGVESVAMLNRMPTLPDQNPLNEKGDLKPWDKTLHSDSSPVSPSPGSSVSHKASNGQSGKSEGIGSRIFGSVEYSLASDDENSDEDDEDMEDMIEEKGSQQFDPFAFKTMESSFGLNNVEFPEWGTGNDHASFLCKPPAFQTNNPATPSPEQKAPSIVPQSNPAPSPPSIIPKINPTTPAPVAGPQAFVNISQQSVSPNPAPVNSIIPNWPAVNVSPIQQVPSQGLPPSRVQCPMPVQNDSTSNNLFQARTNVQQSGTEPVVQDLLTFPAQQFIPVTVEQNLSSIKTNITEFYTPAQSEFSHSPKQVQPQQPPLSARFGNNHPNPSPSPPVLPPPPQDLAMAMDAPPGPVPKGTSISVDTVPRLQPENRQRDDLELSAEETLAIKMVRKQPWLERLNQKEQRALQDLLGYFDAATRVVDIREVVLQEVVGTGAFATVFRGTINGRAIALKKLTKGNGTPMDKMLKDFRSECEMMKRLCHPNIIKLLGTTKQPIGLILEYCSRGALFQLLADTDIPLNWPTKKRIAIDTARGIQHLHKHSIIHRDLKSLNILINEQWSAKVTDFGLSRFKANSTSDKMTGQAGTYHWMAPEVINSEFYTEKADVYSFGIILWEIYTRGIPYDGMQPVQVVAAVVNRGERPRIPMHCPEPLVRLIQLCWHVVPTHRPSFDSILEHLENSM